MTNIQNLSGIFVIHSSCIAGSAMVYYPHKIERMFDSKKEGQLDEG